MLLFLALVGWIGVAEVSALDLEHIDNAVLKGATCNDGSKYGYYIRTTHSDKWLLYLHGGDLCWDIVSCLYREKHSPKSWSSKQWKKHKIGEGVLSALPTNPWWDWNIVSLPYCSSDLWSGSGQFIDWSFQGVANVRETVKQLLSKHSMARASQVVLTGGSAGGIGALVNLDRVAGYLSSTGARVTGVLDAGMFINATGYPGDLFPPVMTIAQEGYKLWKSSFDPKCVAGLRAKGLPAFGCLDAKRALPFTSTPAFVQSAFSDHGVLRHLGLNWPYNTSEKLQYLEYYAGLLEDAWESPLSNRTSIWSPRCCNHAILLDHKASSSITAGGKTFFDALSEWTSDPSSAPKRYIDAPCANGFMCSSGCYTEICSMNNHE